ncbi:MAG TPA: helix-turn-helix domain-containing protein [Jatrophihabitans sp.]|nr:helix-turn-helix domain-containing protein [Jatrophihabitans sp.]
MTDVQQGVEDLATLLGCPVLVEDPQHHPLWWSTQGNVDDVRMRSILLRQPPPAAAALVSRLRLPDAPGPVRTPALPELDMAERWCVPLRSGRDLIGYLWLLDPDGRVGEEDLEPVRRCAAVVADALARTRPTEETRGKRRDHLLARLMAGPDAAAARELVELEGLSPAATVAVSTPAAAGGWPLPGGFSAHTDPSAIGARTSGRPVPIVELAAAVDRASKTDRAIRAGALLPAPTWDALGAWHLVVAAPPEVTPGLVHPGAEVLAEQKRPDLMVTARCVLDNGGDVTASAEQLHIHRTTLYYRLERIEALTGVNLRLAPGRDALQLALQLAAYRAAG